MLPLIISQNQFGFLTGRNIAENVLLAQEIIREINKRNKNINVVVKLDMEKAYDRVSWIFLTKMLRRFDFSEIFIDMTWRLMSTNWYSILINGKSFGFFKFLRGLKQGAFYPQLYSLLGQKCYPEVEISSMRKKTSRGTAYQNGVQRLIILHMQMIQSCLGLLTKDRL